MVNAASEPAGAGIYLDGESFGQTPLDFQLPPGSYQLVMKKGGYKDKATRLEVEPGVKISLNATLRRQ
ncbi:MAG: PEGA domain-containing protein [Gammaproteobacteria bacterium]